MSQNKHDKDPIRGWLPKDYGFALAKMVKPWWWKPLWIVSALGIIIPLLVLFLIGHAPIERVLLALVLACFCLGTAYYIRVRPSITTNRVVYILLGVGIGWIMWIIYAVSGIGHWVTETLGTWPSLIIGFGALSLIGAIIGDWIGKKRNYQVPLTP